MRKEGLFAALLVALGVSACASPAVTDGGADAVAPEATVDAAPPPDAAPEAGLADAAAEADAAPSCDGVRRTFLTWDLTVMPPPDLEVDAGCRGATEHAYLFSDDPVYPAPLSDARIAAVLQAWERATPADPARGIYAIDTGTFGAPPDVDGDPHVYLFYRNIGTFHSFTFDGYFRALDESPGGSSNMLEMLHLNAGPRRPVDGEYMLGVVAHEFVHLLCSRYPAKQVWLSEMLAESGMLLSGYLGDLALAQGWINNGASAPLVGNTAGMDYGPFFLFAEYLVERYGPALLGELARDAGNSTNAFDNVLGRRSAGTFRALFADWTVANFVNSRRMPYGYTNARFDLSTETSATPLAAGAASTANLAGWAAGNYTFDLPAGAASVDLAIASARFSSLEVRAAWYAPSARADAMVSSVALSSASATVTLTPPAGATRLGLIVGNAGTTVAPLSLTATTR